MNIAVKPIIAACLGLACLGVTGCMYHSKHDTYYLISNNLKLPYWKTMYSGFAKAGTDYGVTAQLAGPNDFDPAAELTAFKQTVALKPAGILISVADANLLREEIGTAIEANIPVITVDSDAPRSARLFFIGTNNLAAGHLGGQRLVEKLKDKATSSSTPSPDSPISKSASRAIRISSPPIPRSRSSTSLTPRVMLARPSTRPRSISPGRARTRSTPSSRSNPLVESPSRTYSSVSRSPTARSSRWTSTPAH